MGLLATLFALGAAVALIIVLGAPHIERSLMYSPDPTYTKPAETGLIGVEEETLVTPDGEKVIVWYSQPAPGQPTLLYIHGNAGTLADRSERVAAYQQLGRGICIMSYRGYSGSTGRPSERANLSDAVMTYDALIAKGLRPEDIIAYGESIGSGIAVQLAGKRPVAGIILDAPYTSIVDVAELFYPYLPARQMMRDRYETLKHLKHVEAPMLVVHGEQDSIIPVEMGRKVAEQAHGEAEIVTFPDAGHSDHYNHGSFEVINSWINRLRGGRAEPMAVA